MPENCKICKKQPILYKKWQLCRPCYHKAYYAHTLQTFPQFKSKGKHPPIKISDKCIDDMVREGFTTAQIARTCNMSRQGVHLRVGPNYKSYNRYHKHYEIIFLSKIGFIQMEIAALLKCHAMTVSNVLRKYKIKKPVRISQIMYDLYDKGQTPQQIAKTLNVQETNVYAQLRKYKNYIPAGIRDKHKYKHRFEVNFLKRLGFLNPEIKQLTKLSISSIVNLTNQKFKRK